MFTTKTHMFKFLKEKLSQEFFIKLHKNYGFEKITQD